MKKALRNLTAAVALAALSVVPAGAQAHAADQDPDVQPVSRPTDQTRAQRTLARVLAREQHAYPAANDPGAPAAQRALTRTLAREGRAGWGATDSHPRAHSRPARVGPSRSSPCSPRSS